MVDAPWHLVMPVHNHMLGKPFLFHVTGRTRTSYKRQVIWSWVELQAS